MLRMQALVLVVVLAVSYASAGSLSIGEVFSSASIPEYNRWLREKGSSYPGLAPVLIAADESESGRFRQKTRARFFAPDGGQVKTLTLMNEHGGWLQVRVSRERNRLVVFERAGAGESLLEATTVYDPSGREVFRLREGFLSSIDGGRYLRTFLREGEPYRESSEVLDTEGRLTIPFRTSLEDLNPCTFNHKIEDIQIQLIGGDLGDDEADTVAGGVVSGGVVPGRVVTSASP